MECHAGHHTHWECSDDGPLPATIDRKVRLVFAGLSLEKGTKVSNDVMEKKVYMVKLQSKRHFFFQNPLLKEEVSHSCATGSK